jgi:PAS domain S-box-containing protein
MAVRKHAEQALRQSEERDCKLVDLSPYAIFINRQNRVVYVNPACLQLLRANQPEQLLGKSPLALFHPDFHPLVQERIRRLSETLRQVPPLEEKVVRCDGTLLDVEVRATAYRDDAGMAVQVILRDITERRQTMELLERRVAERTHELH